MGRTATITSDRPARRRPPAPPSLTPPGRWTGIYCRAPIRALRGFQRIHLAPGASQIVRFHLARRDLSMVTEAGDRIIPQGTYTLSVAGGQPGTGAPSVSGSFQVRGQIQLPE